MSRLENSRLQGTADAASASAIGRRGFRAKGAPARGKLVTPGTNTLVFEPIPHAMRHKCVRAVLPVDVWRLLRKITIDAYGKRCAQCGAESQLECHEVWEYTTIAGVDGSISHVMKLIALQALCHLCHVGKHIGFARTDARQYGRVKAHLKSVYRVSDDEFALLERQAVERVAELNRAGLRSLDLTLLNEERFMWIQHRFGRRFTDDELLSCRDLEAVSDVEA